MQKLQHLLVIHASHLLSLLRQNLFDIRAVVVEIPQMVGNQVEIVATGTPNQDDAVVVRLLADLPRSTRVAHSAREHDNHDVVCRFGTGNARQHLLQDERRNQYLHCHAHPSVWSPASLLEALHCLQTA